MLYYCHVRFRVSFTDFFNNVDFDLGSSINVVNFYYLIVANELITLAVHGFLFVYGRGYPTNFIIRINWETNQSVIGLSG